MARHTKTPPTELRTAQINVRVPETLANLAREAAALRGVSRSDWVRLAVEFAATLTMLLEARDPALQAKLGEEAADFEAELTDQLAVRFRETFGREIPDDLLERFLRARAEVE